MRIYFYDTRITPEHQTKLIREKTACYEAEKLNTPALAADMVNHVASLNLMSEEHCYMLAMNTCGIPLGIFFLSKGTVNQSIVGIREVYMRALLAGASCIILFHNHPSTDCTPSREDILLTKRLKEAGELLGIPLADHIIVGGDSFYSFKEHGML